MGLNKCESCIYVFLLNWKKGKNEEMPMDRLHDGGTQKSLRQNPTSTFKTIIMYLNIYTTKYKSEEELLGWVF